MRSFLYTTVATLALSTLGLGRPMPKPDTGDVHVDPDGKVWVEEVVYKTITVQPQAAPTPTPTPSPVQVSSSAPPPPPPPPPSSSPAPIPKPVVKQVNNNNDKPTTAAGATSTKGGLLGDILPSGLVPKPGSSSGGSWIVTEGGSPSQMTFHITNKHDQDISLNYVQNPGSPVPNGKNSIASGEKITVTMAQNWAGNFAVAEARNGHSTADTLIEGSFQPWDASGVPFADFDVSYVSGFTVPVMCKMEGHSSGCSKNLHDLNTCPDQVNAGACGNPAREFNTGAAAAAITVVSPFFAPCENLAYVYPSNDQKSKVNVNLKSQTNVVSCCIGATC